MPKSRSVHYIPKKEKKKKKKLVSLHQQLISASSVQELLRFVSTWLKVIA